MVAMAGIVPSLPGLRTPLGHAHEMLFGYALAVVAGNQLGPMGVARLSVLAGLWALARVAFLATPLSTAAAATNIAFAVLLALHVAPRLLVAAKKRRNQALPLILLREPRDCARYGNSPIPAYRLIKP